MRQSKGLSATPSLAAMVSLMNSSPLFYKFVSVWLAGLNYFVLQYRRFALSSTIYLNRFGLMWRLFHQRNLFSHLFGLSLICWALSIMKNAFCTKHRWLDREWIILYFFPFTRTLSSSSTVSFGDFSVIQYCVVGIWLKRLLHVLSLFRCFEWYLATSYFETWLHHSGCRRSYIGATWNFVWQKNHLDLLNVYLCN
jgi:hypothetical protein